MLVSSASYDSATCKFEAPDPDFGAPTQTESNRSASRSLLFEMAQNSGKKGCNGQSARVRAAAHETPIVQRSKRIQNSFGTFSTTATTTMVVLTRPAWGAAFPATPSRVITKAQPKTPRM